jgi:FeS assembly SUF system protein
MQTEAAAEAATAILADDPATQAERARLEEVTVLGDKIIDALKTIYDPEIPVNIYELGLIYRVDVEDDNKVVIEMTLTSPHCPVAETMPGEVEQKVLTVEGVPACEVKIVWEPSWHPSMMTEEAQLELGIL